MRPPTRAPPSHTSCTWPSGRTARPRSAGSVGSGTGRRRWPPRTGGSSATASAAGGAARSARSRLHAQDQRALLGHDPAVAVDEGELQAGDLTVVAALLHLAHRLGDVAHRPGEARLAEAQLTPVGVHREVAVPPQVMLGDEPTTLATAAEPGLLQFDEHGDRVAVV